MPYFKWEGITLDGIIKKGKGAAYSADELSHRLLQQKIALLHCKQMYTSPFMWPISSLVKSRIFSKLAQLLSAGIMFPDALILTAQYERNPIVCDNLFNYAIDIQSGVLFSRATQKQKKLCDAIAVTMLSAGYESGNVVNACESVSRYYKMQYDFASNVRSALAIPFITLIFFISISLFIFIVIIPRFADMFSSLNHELPMLTRIMINLSNFVRSSSMLLITVSIVGIVMCARYYGKKVNKTLFAGLFSSIPFIGLLLRYHQLGQALNALSLLINSGVSLPQALDVVINSLPHSIIKHDLVFLYDEVQMGALLSVSMLNSLVFLPETVAIVRIGEESGDLGHCLELSAQMYKDILQQKLAWLVFVLQPIMIVILGLLITALIFSVYLPVMELSHAMH